MYDDTYERGRSSHMTLGDRDTHEGVRHEGGVRSSHLTLGDREM